MADSVGEKLGGPDEQLVLLGRITGAHGIRGEVKINSFTAAPEDIAAYGPLSDGKGRTFAVRKLRALKGMAVAAQIAGLSDRNDAEALKGVELYIERARLPETDEEEWYHTDLVGLAAVTPEGETLGEVVAVQDFGAGDLVEIRAAGTAKTMLIPFTKAIVPVVDVKNGRMVVDQPEDEDDARES
jgi:16S rRNA processing protein RimM